MLKALGWFLFLAFDAAIVVWFVMPHGAPPSAPTIPPPSPTELAVTGNSVGGINAFSFNYANDMARTDGTRNAVFSPLTTYAQLILLERAANYRSGRQDSNAVRESSRLLEQLASDPALTFAGELTVSRDIGIDEWLAAEFKRNGIAYSVDLAKLAAMPDRFPGLDAAPPDALFGLWKTRLKVHVEWCVQELELANDKDYFTTASGRKVKRVFQDVLRPGGILSGQTGAPDLIELPFDDGLSMLIVMPQVWDPALAIADLDALSTRKKELIWYDCMDLRNPVFRYSTGGPLEPRLNRMGFSGNYLTGLPFLGAAMLGRAFEVKTDATAVVVWGGGGVLIDAETTTIFSSVGIDRPQIRVALNRPFLYAIRHDATGIIVGLGWVVDPVIEKME